MIPILVQMTSVNLTGVVGMKSLYVLTKILAIVPVVIQRRAVGMILLIVMMVICVQRIAVIRIHQRANILVNTTKWIVMIKMSALQIIAILKMDV
jgi:hypothetical protein